MLSVTRAWRLVKFVDNGMLTLTKCSSCGGHFVTHPHEIARHYVCGLCQPPARAGKGRPAVREAVGAALDDVDAPTLEAEEMDVRTSDDAVIETLAEAVTGLAAPAAAASRRTPKAAVPAPALKVARPAADNDSEVW